MVGEAINIVWLKRDIRTQDHAALDAAERAGIPYLILFLFEPTLITEPDTSLRHLQFNYHSLLDFNKRLHFYNRSAICCYGEAVEVFGYWLSLFQVNTVFSYQESGVQLTWDRDKSVAKLLKSETVKWVEFQRDGIIRGIKNREGWDKRWYAVMNQPVIHNEFSEQTLKASSALLSTLVH